MVQLSKCITKVDNSSIYKRFFRFNNHLPDDCQCSKNIPRLIFLCSHKGITNDGVKIITHFLEPAYNEYGARNDIRNDCILCNC